MLNILLYNWKEGTHDEVNKRQYNIPTATSSAAIAQRSSISNNISTVPNSDALFDRKIDLITEGIEPRCCTSGEACDGQIKGSPKKMNWTNLANEPASKFSQNPVSLSHNTPDLLRIFGIIGCVFLILFKLSSILYFYRSSPDCYRHPKQL